MDKVLQDPPAPVEERITEYEILQSGYHVDLATLVIARLREGWNLAGGVAVNVETNYDNPDRPWQTTWFCQAVWRG